MRPKEFQPPYPLFKDRVLYIPKYATKHRFSLLPSWREIFGNDHPIQIEYCSGNGEWITDKAASHPMYNWIGVEYNFGRTRKIYSKREDKNLDNLLIVSGEALAFTQHYLPSQSIEAAYINFPDPWPKRKHAKRRLIQSPFVQELKRTIRNEGRLTLVTDNFPYFEQMEKTIGATQWKQIPYLQRETYGHSPFERLWRSMGREIYFLHFENPSDQKRG